MGQQVLALVLQAGKISLPAKMKFVMLTQITTAKAAEMPDTPETIAKCKEAYDRIKAEFG